MPSGYTIKIDSSGAIAVEYNSEQKPKRQKGESKLSFPSDFTLIDIETTGLNSDYDSILEIGALRVRNYEVIDTFQSFVAPYENTSDGFRAFQEEDDEDSDVYIPGFVEALTGITIDMLSSAPSIDNVLHSFMDFVGTDILVGHNVNFDINFIFDIWLKLTGANFDNDFVDTLRISRRIYPELPKHSMNFLVENIPLQTKNNHRSIGDCMTCLELYDKCRIIAEENNLLEEWKKKKNHNSRPAQEVSEGNPEDFDPSSPFFDKTCVFTGTLSRMIRKDAMQLVVNIGGQVADNVTKSTDFLIMGQQDYSKFADGKESSKTKKVKSLQEKGQNIHILSEDEFYNIIFDLER